MTKRRNKRPGLIESESRLNLVDETLRLFRLVYYGEYCRPPGTLTDARHSLIAQKRHDFGDSFIAINAALDRREEFANTPIELVQGLAKGLHVALLQCRQHAKQSQATQEIGLGLLDGSGIEVSECCLFENPRAGRA